MARPAPLIRWRAAERPAPAQPPPPPVQAPPQPPAGPRAWGTFEHVPRFHNNYVGLRNRFALLSEAYSYATFEERIKVTNYFIEEALNFASQNIDRLKQAVAAADKEALVGKTLATRAQKKTGGMIEILMGEVEDEKNPVSGAMMYRRKNVSNPEQMTDRLWFEPTTTEEVPAEYYVPASATTSLDLLRKHGIQMRQLTAPVTRRRAVRDYQQHRAAADQQHRHAAARVADARRQVGGGRRREGSGRIVGRADESAARQAGVLSAGADVR